MNGYTHGRSTVAEDSGTYYSGQSTSDATKYNLRNAHSFEDFKSLRAPYDALEEKGLEACGRDSGNPPG